MRLDVGQDEEAGQVAQDAGIYARHRDVQEIINYRSVLEWIDTHAADGRGFALFTEETLKKLHELVVDKLGPEDISSSSVSLISQPSSISQPTSQSANQSTFQPTNSYRTQQVVVRSVESGEVAFRPPVAIDVPFLIQEFFTWLNSREAQDVHPVIRAGIVHYELVRIHPFIDGNGRTARALALLVLYSEGYDVKRFFSLEEYFDKDVQEYYRAILSVQESETQNMTYWLEYFSYGLAIELDRVKEQVLKLSQDLKLKQKLGTQIALSERQIILLEILQRQGQITTAEANEGLPMVSTDTILRDVKDLIEKGIIMKEGVTKGVVYKLVD